MAMPNFGHSGLVSNVEAGVNAGNGAKWAGFVDQLSGEFNSGVKDLNAALSSALKELTANPTDPSLLAKVQSSLSEYTIYRNAQSNASKAFKDIAAGTVQNFR
ncbi:type III secretion system needle filament subunit SctF [Iodobacter sp. LRB]|uniref:Type III secretion system major needle protein (YscF/MxiH/PrgI family) n=1 Tax=Iodobacter fluviatilis TaxID=537 RepID=A0A377Q4I5_9NEIS|nr:MULTISPECIES: type III secretion system needle filament subunit SctF [Iodobacter]TCU80275.1 type III secretion system major needle protein (YscF/MxiH/PrgI family) [Iodobacter fluviatilis]STQ90186.1 type III secretion system needle complex protein PrgI [Iodobacter fluviatilis]